MRVNSMFHYAKLSRSLTSEQTEFVYEENQIIYSKSRWFKKTKTYKVIMTVVCSSTYIVHNPVLCSKGEMHFLCP